MTGLDAPRVASVLGGRRVLRREVHDLSDLMAAVDRGLPPSALAAVTEHVAGGRGAAATALAHLVVPRTTLARRGDRLSREESERLERLARIVAMAEHVWEDTALAREFLISVQPQLDGERPVDLIRSDLGTRRVEDILLALEYGLPA